MIRFEKILVATDFGEASRNALGTAVELAKHFRASLTIVHTYEVPAYVYTGGIPPGDLFAVMVDAAKKDLDDLLADTKKVLPDTRALLHKGSPWREIIAAIEETRADLVVVGTHGRRGLGRALLGSVAEKVVRASPVPVLTVGAH